MAARETKEPAVALVERGGRVRSQRPRPPDVNSHNLRPILLVTQINTASHLMTDSARMYPKIGQHFAAHSMVNHTIDEYVRGNVHDTNTVESYFAILKRGIMGTFPPCLRDPPEALRRRVRLSI